MSNVNAPLRSPAKSTTLFGRAWAATRSTASRKPDTLGTGRATMVCVNRTTASMTDAMPANACGRMRCSSRNGSRTTGYRIGRL
jgi:hypothetical protein